MISKHTIRTSIAVLAIAGAGVAAGIVAASPSNDDAPPAPNEATATPLPTEVDVDTTTSVAVSEPGVEPPVVADEVVANSGSEGQLDGAWSTDGARLVDGSGGEVHIRGVNWFGFETSAGVPHGLWSRNLEEMLDQIADLGFNTIRVPFSAAIIDDDQPVQGIDEAENPDLAGSTSLDVLDRFVAASGERGLAVILDRHTLAPDDRHHLWYDDEYGPERLVTDWEFLADRYRNVPNVIGADLYNEPHDEACWGCGDPTLDWQAAAQEAGDAIHAIEPDWLVFVEGVENADGASCDGPDASGCTWWGGDLSEADDVPVVLAEPNKVVYSPHEYATSVFRQTWFDDPDFPANMPAIWDEFWGDLERTDAAPVMVGEFGTTLDADIDGVWLDALLVYLDEIGAGFTFWTFNPNSGDTGGILEDDWTTVDTDKMSHLEPYLVGPFDPVANQ
ncbi:MAG: glycoside hydrolase family 5 protein [Ilumatobacter sp.]|uniref:glycoside hydrolase family 5 protein n=1 Tax=Ilumatobacter sp. TaxID=1967498 RepID=UPI003C76A775